MSSASAADNDDATVPMTCQGCNGTGQAYLSRFSGSESTCRECLGEGEIFIPADEDADQAQGGVR